MMTIPLEIWALFAVTGILTICTFLSIVRFGDSQRRVLTIVDKRHENTLVKLFVVEIGLLFAAAAWVVVHNFERSFGVINETINQISELQLNRDEWRVLSYAMVNEPSGITPINLPGYEDARSPFGLVVDDEESRFFLIQWVGEPGYGLVLRAIDFVEIDDSGEYPVEQLLRVDDLEGIAVDDKNVYAVTSHRELGKEGKRVRHLLRFSIDRSRLDEPDYRVEVETRDLTKIKDVDLGSTMASAGLEVNDRIWKDDFGRNGLRKDGEPNDPYWEWQQYAVEIEGITVRNDKIIIGLKYPLKAETGEAILLAYDWDKNQFEGFYKVNLGTLGISGLFFDEDSERLIVAASPTAKVRTGYEVQKSDEIRLLGNSKLFLFDWPLASDDDPANRILGNSAARARSKIEGVALSGADIWLAHDGPEPAIVKEPIVKIFPSYLK
ncbi:Uncharacterised protein [Halioglobus japonicus]|nr:Uncharacterised protein [Halioglobus japonicus]